MGRDCGGTLYKGFPGAQWGPCGGKVFIKKFIPRTVKDENSVKSVVVPEEC